MMKYYIEMTLLPGADIDLNFLWMKIYKEIHASLVSTKNSDGLSAVGIAFPGYDMERLTLGSKLRLFANTIEELEALNLKKSLNRLLDYIHLTKVRNVPENIKGYVCFKRQQSKSNIERLARRKARHQSIDIAEALKSFGKKEVKYVKAPFIMTSSSSTKQKYRIFIVKENASSHIDNGFNCYGLSNLSTVPEF